MRDPKELEYKSTVPGAENLNWSQKWAKAMRPQTPRDNSQGGQPHWTPGTMGCFASHYSLWKKCYEEDETLTILNRKSTRLNSSHTDISRMPSSA